MVLNAAGPVARERALVGSTVLYESGSGLLAREQVAAMLQRMDTEWLRRVALSEMARDREVVTTRLDLIARLLADLDSVGEVTQTRLAQDRLLRHAVERILGQLVELAVSVNSHLVAATRGTAPTTYRQSFLDMAELGAVPGELASRLAMAAGLRNVLAHEYVDIDVGLVAEAVPAARQGFREYLRDVAAYVGL